jgi:hypothetical protein
MKPRRTPESNTVLGLLEGNEDNDLWVTRTVDHVDDPVIRSVWEPTDDERRRIADGENVYLVVWGRLHPPVALGVTDEPLGRARVQS